MAEIVRSPAIKARNVEKALSAVSGQSDFKSNKDTVKKALSPPKGVDEIFDGLSKSTGVINDSFREILQSEWLESLQVANPFEGPGEEKEIDLRKMVMRYQSEYYKLQDKAIEVGRDLITYSITQQRLLPKLGTPASSMTFEKYVEVNGTIVNKYLDKAQELYQFHLDFRRDWQSAQDTVEKSIKELISKISTTKKQLEEAKEELKKKSLIAALTFIGAVVCFAAAALIPGVGVLAVMIGVTLLGTSIQQIISASQLTGVIRGYTDSLNTANTSQQRLEMLKDPMTKIGNDVSKVTGVWSDIVTHLKNIDTAMVTPELLEILRDDVIGDWKNVEDKIRDYIDILNGLK